MMITPLCLLPLYFSAWSAKWRPWGRWGTCSVTCGGGRRSRRRTCVRTSAKVQCTGRPVEVQKCGKAPCPCMWKSHCSLYLCSYDVWHFGIHVSTAKCQLACPEGRPSEDCSLCVCEGHILHGEVLSVTGVPVAGAWVALAIQPKVVLARTDTKGQFRVTGVCSSSSTLISISKDKFAPVTVSSTSNTTGISWVHAVLRSAGKCLKETSFWHLRTKWHHAPCAIVRSRLNPSWF